MNVESAAFALIAATVVEDALRRRMQDAMTARQKHWSLPPDWSPEQRVRAAAVLLHWRNDNPNQPHPEEEKLLEILGGSRPDPAMFAALINEHIRKVLAEAVAADEQARADVALRNASADLRAAQRDYDLAVIEATARGEEGCRAFAGTVTGPPQPLAVIVIDLSPVMGPARRTRYLVRAIGDTRAELYDAGGRCLIDGKLTLHVGSSPPPQNQG